MELAGVSARIDVGQTPGRLLSCNYAFEASSSSSLGAGDNCKGLDLKMAIYRYSPLISMPLFASCHFTAASSERMFHLLAQGAQTRQLGQIQACS